MKKNEIRISKTYWTWRDRGNNYQTYPIKIVRYDSEIGRYEAELPAEEGFTESLWLADHEIYSTEKEALISMCDAMEYTIDSYQKDIALAEAGMNKLRFDLAKATKRIADIHESYPENQKGESHD